MTDDVMEKEPAPASEVSQELDAKLNETKALALQVLSSKPDNVDALFGLGTVLSEQRQYDNALEAFRLALLVDSTREDVRRGFLRTVNRQARAFADNGAFGAAAGTLEEAIDLVPDDLSLYRRLTHFLVRAGSHELALAAADLAVEREPEDPANFEARGYALAALGNLEGAIDAYECALHYDPKLVSAHVNLGNVLSAQGRRNAAMDHFNKALALDRDSPEAHNNIGNAFADMLELDKAEKHLRQAVELNPDFAQAHFNLSMALLMQGKFDEGWDEYEWRWQCPEFPSTRRAFPYPLWEGDDLAGKTILVWSEQGVGDEIMFANTLPDVARAAGHLVIECNDRFKPLFERSYPDATVVVRQDPPDPAIEQAGIDVQTPMASLCRHFRRSAEAFPREPGRYLVADPEKTAACRARYEALGPGRLVGISWRSGNPVKGVERSAPLELWDGILRRLDCRIICLQYGDIDSDLVKAMQRTGAPIYCDPEINPLESMDDWAAQVAAMDLVISVDNSTIQVSGSLGIPTWTLLSYVPEWRFGPKGDDHLWHPSIRVVRQPKPGDWDSVFNRVAHMLDQQRIAAEG